MKALSLESFRIVLRRNRKKSIETTPLAIDFTEMNSIWDMNFVYFCFVFIHSMKKNYLDLISVTKQSLSHSLYSELIYSNSFTFFFCILRSNWRVELVEIFENNSMQKKATDDGNELFFVCVCEFEWVCMYVWVLLVPIVKTEAPET